MLRRRDRRRKLPESVALAQRAGVERPVGNAPIRRAAARRPGRVKMIDWSSLAYGHDWWFQGDGTHLLRPGVAAYTRLLKRAVWARQRGSFG